MILEKLTKNQCKERTIEGKDFVVPTGDQPKDLPGGGKHYFSSGGWGDSGHLLGSRK